MRCNTRLAVCLFLSIPALCQAAESPAQAAFEQLKTLVGQWRATESGRETLVEITQIAGGSTLVETWTMSPTRQSMTVYTMDGTRLLATHYCPQGNAPRLVFTETDGAGAHHFLFLDGANLQDPAGSHEHAFWIRHAPDGKLTRNETYIANGAEYDRDHDTGSTQVFMRISP